MKRFILSTSGLNRNGYRVKTSGIRLDRFKDNPVMFVNHDHDELPIGKWKDVAVNGDNLEGTPEFDPNDEYAVKVQKKVEGGFMSGCSIGFWVNAWSEAPEDMLPGQVLPTVTDCELMECSIVGMPGNGAAVTLMFESQAAFDKFTAKAPEELTLALKAQQTFTPVAGGKPATPPPVQTLDFSMKSIASLVALLGLALAASATDEQRLEAIETEVKRLKQAELDGLMALAASKGMTADANMRKLAAADPKAFSEWIGALAAAPTATPETPAPTATGAGAEAQAQRETLADLIRQQQLNAGAQATTEVPDLHKLWVEKGEAGVKELQSKNPTLYAAAYKKAYGVDPQ